MRALSCAVHISAGHPRLGSHAWLSPPLPPLPPPLLPSLPLPLLAAVQSGGGALQPAARHLGRGASRGASRAQPLYTYEHLRSSIPAHPPLTGQDSPKGGAVCSLCFCHKPL